MPHNLWGKHLQTHEAESSLLQSNPHRYSSSEWSISAKSQDHLPIARTGSCTPLAARHPTVDQGTITPEINTLPTSQMEQWNPMDQTAGRKSWAQSSWSHTHLPVEKQHWKRRHQMLLTTWFPVPWWMQPANTCPETLFVIHKPPLHCWIPTKQVAYWPVSSQKKHHGWCYRLHQLSQHPLTDHPRTGCHSVPAQPEKENKWLNGASPLRSTRRD